MRSPVVLVFGEDENDRQAIKELFEALRPGAPVSVQKRRRPLVQVKGRTEANARRNAVGIAEVVRADMKRHPVIAVLAHEDADAVEDAHEAVAARIEEVLNGIAPEIIGVVPAFEMEAWWYLWPSAVAAVNSKWRPLTRGGRVGLIVDAKENLRRDLRRPNVRDYTESDGPKIAGQVRTLGIVLQPSAMSLSWERFKARVVALAL